MRWCLFIIGSLMDYTVPARNIIISFLLTWYFLPNSFRLALHPVIGQGLDGPRCMGVWFGGCFRGLTQGGWEDHYVSPTGSSGLLAIACHPDLSEIVCFWLRLLSALAPCLGVHPLPTYAWLRILHVCLASRCETGWYFWAAFAYLSCDSGMWLSIPETR